MSASEGMPSLARAREAGLEAKTRSFFGRETNLLAREPDENVMIIALVVRALVQHRSVVDERVFLSGSAIKKLRDAGLQPPKPRARFERFADRALAQIHDRKGHVCTHCTYTPGFALCPMCLGRGQVVQNQSSLLRQNEHPITCPTCRGSTRAQCGPCDGETQVFPVTTRTMRVGVGELEYVFLPAMPPSLHASITRVLLGAEALPPAWSFDIDRPIVNESMSYRSHIPIGPPRIYDIDAGVPLMEARAALQRLSGGHEVIDRAVECFAIPVCMLRFGKVDVALVSTAASAMCVLVEDEPT